MKRWISAFLGIGLMFSSISGVASAETTGFTDIKGHWAESIINEAVERGITSGVSETKFAPNDKLTYEQFMTMLARTLTEKDFIEDKVSGCNIVLTNYNEEFKATNGDTAKLKEYRNSYLKNNTDLNEKLVKKIESNISDFNTSGVCRVNSWSNYLTNSQNQPYAVGDDILSKTTSWAKPALTTVPYVAGFASYYDFISGNGKNIKDYNYTAFKDGLTPYNYLEWVSNYQNKRIDKVYDKLNMKYIKSDRYDSISRADMALILYSFLNYDEQKLIAYKQDNFYYNTWDSNSNPWFKQDLNYKTFKSNYTDLPKYFQLDTMIANKLPYEYSYYMYKPERVFAKNAIGTDGKVHTNYEATHTNEGITLTNRGVILAVSDAGLLSGSGNKFNPEKSLTRAEGVAVALKLDAFLQDRYNFVNGNSSSNENNEVNENESIKSTLTKYYDAVYVKDLATYNGTWLNLDDKNKRLNEDWFKSATHKYEMDSFNVESLNHNEATVLVDIITKKINTDNKDAYYIEMKAKQKFKLYMKKVESDWKIEKMELVGSMQHLPIDNPEEI